MEVLPEALSTSAPKRKPKSLSLRCRKGPDRAIADASANAALSHPSIDRAQRISIEAFLVLALMKPN